MCARPRLRDATGHRGSDERFEPVVDDPVEELGGMRAALQGLAVELEERVHRGFASPGIVPEWQAVLDAVQKLSHVGTGPVGYWGVSLGCVIGVPFVAAEPRVRAAVLGLGGAEVSAEAAARITVPVEFLLQWDDERVPRTQSLTLFDALVSAEKTLHANPGKHGEVPAFEIDSTLRFFARHLC
jgi:dienelactone hydrolase